MDFITNTDIFSSVNTVNTANKSSGVGNSSEVVEDFQNVLLQAFRSVNDAQHESTDLAQQMILDPNSVDVHDVTIALSKAEMALNITKSVVEKSLQAYKEIINIR